MHILFVQWYICDAQFLFPSNGEVLRSMELFLEIEEAMSLLQKDAITLELKLLKHKHNFNSYVMTEHEC